ncbi:hypothetical protein [Aquimarina sp. AU474]|uniref:hypothetical protein n=1 Tax=Aquimarina sp. AU474 TaxID=2108529 RepID=UPI000D694546|nr:hypothetical protein [Aquimarina sp. AU474]
MKTTISCFIFLLSATGISAQEINTTTLDDNRNNEVAEVVKTNTDISSYQSSQKDYTLEEKIICYSEISKVTFYEALIRQNNFDIRLKDSQIVLRNTEDIITNNKQRISYSD